jgi:hypothetical protein
MEENLQNIYVQYLYYIPAHFCISTKGFNENEHSLLELWFHNNHEEHCL